MYCAISENSDSVQMQQRVESFNQIKSVIKSQPNVSIDRNSTSFPNALRLTIQHRDDKILELCSFVKDQLKDRGGFLLDMAFDFCMTVIGQQQVTLAIVGRSNSGKSILATELIGREVILSSSDESSNFSLNRIVHNEENIVRIYRCETPKYRGEIEEILSSEMTFSNSSSMNDYLQGLMYSSTNENVLQIIEIGIPSDLLKSLRIIDCPGLNYDSNLSQIVYSLLEYVNPSIICYVYDSRLGFTMIDGQILDEIHHHLEDNCAHCVQYIFIENRVDVKTVNKYDDQPKTKEKDFNLEQTRKSISKCCKFELSDKCGGGEKWFKFDKSRLQSVLPLNSVADIDHNSTKDKIETLPNLCQECVMNLQKETCQKVGHYYIPIIDIFAVRIAQNFQPRYKRMNAEHLFKIELPINLFYDLKSLSVDEELIDLINKSCFTEQNILLRFSEEFKIFSLTYEEENILVTVISRLNLLQEKCKLFIDRFDLSASKSAFVFENCETSSLYLIEKRMSFRRLVDCLDDCHLNIHVMETFIYQLANKYAESDIETFGTNFRRNFRPDNIYLDTDRQLYVNRSIPADPGLPLLLKDKSEHEPFFIHPSIRENYENLMKNLFLNDGIAMAEFIYSFGWFIWILVEGTGVVSGSFHQNSCLESLKSGRYPNYPTYLEEVMKLCWNIQVDADSKKWFLYWRDILLKINSNFWIRSQSLTVNHALIDRIEESSTQHQLDFSRGFKLSFIQFENQEYHVTSLIKNDEIDVNQEVIRIYNENVTSSHHHHYHPEIYQSDEGSVIYIIRISMTSTRLIDNLHEFQLVDMIQFVKQIVSMHNDLESAVIVNFRADNIYLDKSKQLLLINRDIPNHPKLPFILANNKITESFHLNSEFIARYAQCYSPSQMSNRIEILEFIFSFGWFVWILMDGAGERVIHSDWEQNELLASLQYGRFSNYPSQIREIIRLCWSVKLIEGNLLQIWSEIKSFMNLI